MNEEVPRPEEPRPAPPSKPVEGQPLTGWQEIELERGRRARRWLRRLGIGIGLLVVVFLAGCGALVAGCTASKPDVDRSVEAVRQAASSGDTDSRALYIEGNFTEKDLKQIQKVYTRAGTLRSSKSAGMTSAWTLAPVNSGAHSLFCMKRSMSTGFLLKSLCLYHTVELGVSGHIESVPKTSLWLPRSVLAPAQIHLTVLDPRIEEQRPVRHVPEPRVERHRVQLRRKRRAEEATRPRFRFDRTHQRRAVAETSMLR